MKKPSQRKEQKKDQKEKITKTDDETSLVFPCELDDRLTVAIVFPENDSYKTLESSFAESHGFLLHDENLIVVDGKILQEDWFTSDHLLVIQAHELGHYNLEHIRSGTRSEEMDADVVGYRILSSLNCESAASLHWDLIWDRYRCIPEDNVIQSPKYIFDAVDKTVSYTRVNV